MHDFKRGNGVIRVMLSGYGPLLVRAYVYVTNNEIYGAYLPVLFQFGVVGAVFKNNHVHDYVWAAITCGNMVHLQGDCMLTSISNNLVVAKGRNLTGGGDATGIYYVTHWNNPGNLAECNYVIGGDHCYYLDYASSGVTIRGGACIGMVDGMKVNNGKWNRISHVVMKGTELTPGWCTCLTATVCNCLKDPGNYWDRMQAKYYSSAVFQQRWPWMKNTCSESSVNGTPCNTNAPGTLKDTETGKCSGLPTNNYIDLVLVDVQDADMNYRYCEQLPNVPKLNTHRHINSASMACMSFMDALRVAAKTKEAPSEWFGSNGWPAECQEPIAIPNLKKRKQCESEPPRLKPRTLPVSSGAPTTSTSSTKLLVLPDLATLMPRSEHRSEPPLVRSNTSVPARQPLDAPRLVRACTTTNRGMRRDSQNDTLPTQNPSLSSRPAHSSGCVTASQHPPPPSRFAPNGAVNFDFHDAATDWVKAVASSLRGEYVVPPPAPGRNQLTESVPEKPAQGERSKMAQQLDFRIQMQQQDDAKHEKKLSLSEILQWEAEMVSSVCPKARPAPPTVKIPVFSFSDPLEVKPAVTNQTADVEAEKLDDKLFIDELLMEFDMYSMATPAAVPGSNAWEPAVPPTPSGIPPTPSAPAGGFASLWSEAWTDGFNVDLSSLAGNPALW
ncbi:unnamed protein product [Closterium sp. Yama58-4]|nr:unnamed protein product [Closterium sp. Yama58-4]